MTKESVGINKLGRLINDIRGMLSIENSMGLTLGTLTYKFLSETFEKQVKEDIPSNTSYEKAWDIAIEYEQFIQPIAERLGYEIAPTYLWSNLVSMIENNSISFDISIYRQALNELEKSSYKYESNEVFGHLFDIVPVEERLLGRTDIEETVVIKRFIEVIDQVEPSEEVFKYLLDSFSRSAGKTGYFLPSLSHQSLIAKIVTSNKQTVDAIYDPTVGTASTLLAVNDECEVGVFSGQEMNSFVLNIAYMNLLISGKNHRQIDIKLGNVLTESRHIDQKYDVIVSEPPFSMDWSHDRVKVNDPRFSSYKKIAPKSKADYAFIQHMLHHLSDEGTMAVIVANGVLFRGAAEGIIRQQLIEEMNVLDAVIALPSHLYNATAIPVSLLVFKKQRNQQDHILFIDASNDYVKADRARNALKAEHIEKIVEVYKGYINVERYARIVSLQEVEANEYNLTMSRYVDTSEPIKPLDTEALRHTLIQKKAELSDIGNQLSVRMKELGW